MNVNENVAIRAENLSMHFNMASEKVDSLRDYLTKLTSKNCSIMIS